MKKREEGERERGEAEFVYAIANKIKVGNHSPLVLHNRNPL